MGALLGIMIAHLIFYLPIVQFATKFRSGYPFWISEFISTLILLFVIKHFSNTNKNQIPLMVSLLVTAGYLFTSSTFFCKSCINNRKEFYRYFCWNLFRQHHWLCNFTITSYACLYIFC